MKRSKPGRLIKIPRMEVEEERAGGAQSETRVSGFKIARLDLE